jgi:hypothetical protein
MKVVRLSIPVRLAVPPLLICSIPKRAIGFSFEGGKPALLLGGTLVALTLALSAILFPSTGILGPILFLWLFGSTGAVFLYNGSRRVAFVKSLCTGCRLLPIIEEHEKIHLGGVESDLEVWNQMRKRHSCESLELVGDKTICTFCPIPKRLSEH